MAAPFLNIDLGELPDEPEELYECAQLANIACGGHAGDRATMEKAISRALRHGTGIGAHPSFPDREHFGRVALVATADEVRSFVGEQCAALAGVARELGAEVGHVKPHGALYHEANGNPILAAALVAGALDALGGAFTLVGPPAGALHSAALAAGIDFAREGFADRGLMPDGTLVPRGQPGALIEQPERSGAQAARLAASGAFDTLCIHGDTPGAVAIARAVRAALDGLERGDRLRDRGAES